MRPLVILRPEPGGSRTAARAEAMGLEARLLPLFAVVPVHWTAPDPAGFDGLLLTSANAVRHGGAELEQLKPLPVHAVGEATARLARAAGFDVVSVGDGGSGDMALPKDGRLLHLSGRHHLPTRAAMTISVYEARPLPPPDGIAALLGAVVAVHSPRSGRRLAELIERRSATVIAAISQAAAEACGGGWAKVEAASQPNDEALLALAARLCESPVR